MESVQLTSFTDLYESVPVLHLDGEIDISTAPLLRDAIVALSRDGHSHIIIDMANVSFMDSSGFGTLLSASRPLQRIGGSLSLVGCNDTITRMMNITRINTILPVVMSYDDAIERIHLASPQPARA